MKKFILYANITVSQKEVSFKTQFQTFYRPSIFVVSLMSQILIAYNVTTSSHCVQQIVTTPTVL